MELQQIELSNLKPASANVRKKGAKEVSDLLTSIRAQGLLQPLLVRLNCEGYEVVAGQRRLLALQKLAQEEDGITEIPCLVMDAGDDAKAIEASLAENIARLPMDEVDQYKAFAALIKQGMATEDIAARFGITERLVTKRLAIADLIPGILSAYQRGDIDPATLRNLTMATKKQQKTWLELFKSEDEYAPTGRRLRSWLLGGHQIATTNALFDLSDYQGTLITDLFGDEVYFDDPDKFWPLQNAAIAKLREEFLEGGWQEVVVLDIGEQWHRWEFVDTAKEDGGRVYIVPSPHGEVTIYEGLRPEDEVKRQEKTADGGTPPAPKAEITKVMQNYLDLHRHAAVRLSLLSRSDIALRLAVAQIIASSELWEVRANPQKAANDDITQSLQDSEAQDLFHQKGQEIAASLGIKGHDKETLVPRKQDGYAYHDFHAVFSGLLGMKDAQVMDILAFVVAETLVSGDAVVETLGKLLDTKVAGHWSPDETFLELLRDKEAINAMLSDVAGKPVAEGNITATGKVQKKIIRNCLDGIREAVKPDWLPRYMEFPMRAYTKRGGVRAVADWKQVKKHYK